MHRGRSCYLYTQDIRIPQHHHYLLYMHDMGLISESLEQINQDKEALRWYYKMPDLGKASM